MNTKLTLRMDDKLIEAAKKHSTETGKSLSKLVADFFANLENEKKTNTFKISPKVQSLRGILKGSDISKDDYKTHLEKKYL